MSLDETVKQEILQTVERIRRKEFVKQTYRELLASPLRDRIVGNLAPLYYVDLAFLDEVMELFRSDIGTLPAYTYLAEEDPFLFQTRYEGVGRGVLRNSLGAFARSHPEFLQLFNERHYSTISGLEFPLDEYIRVAPTEGIAALKQHLLIRKHIPSEIAFVLKEIAAVDREYALMLSDELLARENSKDEGAIFNFLAGEDLGRALQLASSFALRKENVSDWSLGEGFARIAENSESVYLFLCEQQLKKSIAKERKTIGNEGLRKGLIGLAKHGKEKVFEAHDILLQVDAVEGYGLNYSRLFDAEILEELEKKGFDALADEFAERLPWYTDSDRLTRLLPRLAKEDPERFLQLCENPENQENIFYHYKTATLLATLNPGLLEQLLSSRVSLNDNLVEELLDKTPDFAMTVIDSLYRAFHNKHKLIAFAASREPTWSVERIRELMQAGDTTSQLTAADTIGSIAMTLKEKALLPVQDGEYRFYERLIHGAATKEIAEKAITLAEMNGYGRAQAILSHRPECPLEELVELAGIEGPFVPVARLGEGSKGTTYKVFTPGIGQFRALKILKEGVHPNEDEGRILGTLRGEDLDNIVQVYDAGDDLATVNGRSRYAILMEYIDGKTLRESEGPDANRALLVGARLLRGIDSLRKRGITHRDLNLDNIMTYDVDGLKIVDFGLATREANPIQVDARRYGSPGQADDLFSLGLIMYRLATGEHLVTARSGSMTTDTYAQAVMDMKTELYEGAVLSIPYQRKVNEAGKPIADVILSCLLTTQPTLDRVLHAMDDISVELSLYTRSRMDLWHSLYQAEKQMHSLAGENEQLRKENEALRRAQESS